MNVPGDNLTANDRRIALIVALAASMLGGGAIGTKVNDDAGTAQVAALAQNVQHLGEAVRELKAEVKELRAHTVRVQP